MKAYLGVFSVFLSLTLIKPVTAAIMDEETRNALNRDDERPVTVVIGLKNPLDLERLPKHFSSPEEKQKKIVKMLEAHTQASLRQRFPFLATDEDFEEVTPLWINHSVKVRAKASAIKKLQTLAPGGIEKIEIEKPKEVSELMDDVGNASVARLSGLPEIGWGVEKLKAPELWNLGFKGQGVLVAVVDSGANPTHPDLVKNLWRNPGETGTDDQGRDKALNGVDDDSNGYIDDFNGFNFEKKNGNIKDDQGHGTQTAGIVGGTGAKGTQTGVAPEATLMILKACCTVSGATGESAIWEAMQYAAKNGARVISMSLSIKHFLKPDYAKWRKASESILAMGVIHINSAGNRGGNSVPTNVGAPPANPPAWFHPKQTSVGQSKPTSMISIGATDEGDKIREYSSRGPVTWEKITDYQDFPWESGNNNKPGLIRPDVCGPSEVPSLEMTGEGYTVSFGGTSSATPHIGGVAAVLLSAFPKATVEQMMEALQMSAVPVGSDFNNNCGAGRVDTLAAYQYLSKIL